MNYLTLLTLFPKKINVTLIDAISNELIGKHKILKDDLPESFTSPTTLNINGEDWQVLKADPISADDFHYTKRLKLLVQKKAFFDKLNHQSLVPTISGISPITIAQLCSTFIQLSSWLQLQFLPASMMPIIQNDLQQINMILEVQNNLNGYEQVYIRENIPLHCLNIPMQDFLNKIKAVSKGPLGIYSLGSIAESFVITSKDHTYYGIEDAGIITSLCLLQFNHIDDEFAAITEYFQLVFVDWCNGTVIAI